MISGRDRRLGLVAGLLLGSALGRPFNGLKGGHIQQLAGGPVEGFLKDPVLQPDKPNRNCLPGVHGITGQEFLAALAGLTEDETGRDHAAMCAAHLKDLHGLEDPAAAIPSALRRPGGPLRRALERWAAEYPWEAEDHFAREELSEGASPAPRALAAALEGNARTLPLSRLTHVKEPPLAAGALAQLTAEAVATEDNPKKLSSLAVTRHLVTLMEAFEENLRAEDAMMPVWKDLRFGYPVARLSDAITTIPALLETGDDALAERTFVKKAREFAPDRAVTHAQHGFAPVLLPWVLYRALGPMSPPQAVEDVINRGGETELAGALVGALMGARYGIGSWPEEWLEQLRIWPAAKSLTEAPNGASVAAWLDAERRLTSEEEAFRAPLQKALEKRQTAGEAPKKKPPKPKKDSEPIIDRGYLPHDPEPQAWLEEKGDELAPWEKQRLKSERGRKRIDWKETRRKKQRDDGSPDPEPDE